MERSEDVADGVNPLDWEIGVLRERIEGVRIYVDEYRTQLDRIDQEVRMFAASWGWVPAEQG